MKYLKRIDEFFYTPWIDKIPETDDKTVLKEFMKRVANEMGEELVETEGDVSGSYIASGGFGSTFKTKSGKVLKLTSDALEAYRAWKLSKKPSSQYLMDYYDVRLVVDEDETYPKFIILMDAIKPIREEKNTLEESVRVDVWRSFMHLQYSTNAINTWLGKTANDFWVNVLSNQRVGDYILEKFDITYEDYKERQREYLEEVWDNLQGILKELKKYKIFYFDLHDGNVGYNERNGNIVFYDIGGENAEDFNEDKFMKNVKRIDIDIEELSEKKDELKPLADDILALEETEDGEFIPIEGPVEIEQVVDIIKDESVISKIEENITVDTAVSVGEVKRGQIIYLTALLKRPRQSTPFNQTTMGVLKCRIIDYFYGLNKLKQVMKNK